jgi:SAM-dependent methyltransferase/ectoine hydroxylase-related dioxygenase (phytanoyl-CoA dioxygenase family)
MEKPVLPSPADARFRSMVKEIAQDDTMFDGSVEHYLSVGLSAMQAIEAALEGLPAPRRILDLPCGHGRVTRLLRARFPDAAITVSDIDRSGVAFAANWFRAQGVPSDGDFRHLDLHGEFDLIWVGSLLTHLSAPMARQLLDFAVRHMAPGATLVMSSHGLWVAERLQSWDYGLGPQLARAVLKEYEHTGYGYRDYPGGQGYGISLISRNWIDEALAGSPLRLVSYTERGWDDHQDVLVMRLAADLDGGSQVGGSSVLSGLYTLTLAKFSRQKRRRAHDAWFESRHVPAPPNERSDATMPSHTQEADMPFDEDWYLATYTDVAAAVAAGDFQSALDHYRSHGATEGRMPCRPRPEAPAAEGEFDETWYLNAYPDVADAVRSGALRSGFTHWMKSGKAEGRIPPPGYTEGESFDADWYAASYHAVAADIAAGLAQDADEHYRLIGRFRGYLPNRFAPRPDDPAGIASRFGGSWLDHGNALDLIEGRLDLGQINHAQADLLRHWVRHGYVILRGAIPEAQVTAAAEALRKAYDGEMPEVKFECHAVGGYRPVAWDKAVQVHPAKALDLHWWSPAIRNLIVAPPVRATLGVIFGRRVMASQSLTFLRGSAQGYHQDTLYVPYSLPTQFAASWIALEDVTPGAGELTYLEGSHRLPDFLYGGQYKTLWDAQRMVRKNELRAEMEDYSVKLEQRCLEAGMHASTFLAKRGDVLIWHADLAHGGLPISPHTTRRSVVTHYCPKEVAPLVFERGRTDVRVHEGLAWYSTGHYAEN